MMKLLLTFALVLTSSLAFSLTPETEQFLKKNKILIKSDLIEETHIERFKQSYTKFPIEFTHELIKLGRKIHLIYGHGVSDDPTWKDNNKTFDGRDWAEVPGAGGSPYAYAPTRIVVNRMDEGHGSVDLFLHEEAHTMDSTYGSFKISSSEPFKQLMTNPSVTHYLDSISSVGYYQNFAEAFAEIFARFHAGPDSKKILEEKAPEAAEFIKNLKSIREASKKGQAVSIF
jgi:hypothetical protein